MYKILSISVLLLIISGCSNFTINATMCEQMASEPNAVIPQECQKYSEKKAQKSFDKFKDKHKNNEDIIKFSKDADDKQN
mgnify:FL=1